MAQFVKMPVEILERTDLSPSAKLVYGALLDRIGGNGVAWPGVRKLAATCGLSPTTVQDSIRRLEASGLISVERSGGNPARASNRYRLCERSESGTCQKPCAPETEQCAHQKPNTVRSESGTDSDPGIQTQRFRKFERGGAGERIFGAYPKQTGKKPALVAIGAALEEIAARGIDDPVDFLLERVQKYGAARAGHDPRYTMNPKRFFDEGHYDDDPRTWERTQKCGAGKRQATPAAAGSSRRGAGKPGEFVEEPGGIPLRRFGG